MIEIDKSWIDEFKKKHGRSPRILHIGNIANNAYYNSKFLNRHGLDCDVILVDYYFIMGTPEWADADFDGSIEDQYYPDWRSVDLKGFVRPRWFAQGPLDLCVKYLVSKNEARKSAASFWWTLLDWHRFFLCSRRFKWLRVLAVLWRTAGEHLRALHKKIESVEDCFTGIRNRAFPLGRTFYHLLALLFYLITLPIYIPVIFVKALRKARRLFARLTGEKRESGEGKDSFFDRRAKAVVDFYGELFKDGKESLRPEHLEVFRASMPKWKRLFSHYDIIQAYSNEPVLPLMAGKKPYIAFEHGTLRELTVNDTLICRFILTAYKKADHLFITNGDCLKYAEQIGITNYTPMLHPIDSTTIRTISGDYEGLHRRYNSRYLFICPLRHDWAIKGTDFYIRALPGITDALGGDFKILFTRWGSQVEESRTLAEELGVERFIEWIEPLPHCALIRLIKSVDAVCDQMVLHCFGATAPESIAAGIPVIMSYKPETTAWILSEPAPILSAFTTENIVEQIKRAIDPEWLKEYKIRADKWFESCHSPDIAVRDHIKTYRNLLGFRP